MKPFGWRDAVNAAVETWYFTERKMRVRGIRTASGWTYIMEAPPRCASTFVGGRLTPCEGWVRFYAPRPALTPVAARFHRGVEQVRRVPLCVHHARVLGYDQYAPEPARVRVP